MHAAVVTSFTEPPRYQPFDDPVAHGEHDEVVQVLAAGLHPRVRSGASGSHYTSTWGAPTQRALPAIVARRDDDAQPLTWLQIGAIAGPSIELHSAWLRAARVDIVGSGQGSVPASAIVAELPALTAEITAGTFAVSPVPTPLSQIQAACIAPAVSGQRIVITPN
jgi:hypothetical protein